ncbi:MAG: FHA domain-containing protein [Eubacteriales bacterium]|nr:FHA domain-containing protein [Eubacteriales bacterium]
MSILSQIGVVILIVCIIFILVRANRTLEDAAREGEHFVDEWELRQQKKEERLLQKKEKAEKKKLERKETWRRASSPGSGEENLLSETWKEEPKPKEEGSEEECFVQAEIEAVEEEAIFSSKIVSMRRYKNPGIVLVEMDVNHRPVRRIPVERLPFTIGRSPDNMLVLDDLYVARKHGRIVEEGGNYILEDMGTANKIFADGKVTDRVTLSHKQTFYLGNVEFCVELEKEGAGAPFRYQRAEEEYYE